MKKTILFLTGFALSFQAYAASTKTQEELSDEVNQATQDQIPQEEGSVVIGLKMKPIFEELQKDIKTKSDIDLVKKLAEQGDVESQYILSQMYYRGKKVPKDLKATFYWLQKAATGGLASAQWALGFFYSGDSITDQDYDNVTDEKDKEKSAYWMEKAAEQNYVNGTASAQVSIGRIYANGRGVKKDLEKAIEWLERANANGDEWAVFHLRIAYIDYAEELRATADKYVQKEDELRIKKQRKRK